MNEPERPTSSSVKKLSMALLGLVGLALLWITVDVLRAAVWPGDPIWIFPTSEGLQRLDVPAMPLWDYEGVVAILSLSDICWLYGLSHLFVMSKRFMHGDVLTTASVSHLLHFGWALLASAVAEYITPFAAGSLLAARGHLASFNHWGFLLNSEVLGTGIGATLIILITKIFREAVILSDEARLTI
jgi:hypothetical protein